MRIFRHILCLPLALLAVTYHAEAQLSDALPPLSYAPTGVDISPFDALRGGKRALKDGRSRDGLAGLAYAAQMGNLEAISMLADMYDKGEGVPQDRAKAYDLFLKLANKYADVNPASPNAQHVALAFVFLGDAYHKGLPEAGIKPDPYQARRLFSHAASYFGDPQAQLRLGELLLEDKNNPAQQFQALRWLKLAAEKNNRHAQGLLGKVMFFSSYTKDLRGEGLFWLSIASSNETDSSSTPGPTGTALERALRESSHDERRTASDMVSVWQDALQVDHGLEKTQPKDIRHRDFSQLLRNMPVSALPLEPVR